MSRFSSFHTRKGGLISGSVLKKCVKSLCWSYNLYVDSAQGSDLAPFLFLEIWAVVKNFLRLSHLYTQLNSSVSNPNITFYCNFQLLSIPIKIFGVVNLWSGWNNSPMWQCVSVLKHSQLFFWKSIIYWLFYFQACEFLLPNTVKSRAVDRSTIQRSKVQVQRSQYIRIKFPLHKESENPWACY